MDKTHHRKSKWKQAAVPAALVSLSLTACVNSSNETKPASTTSSPSSVPTTVSTSETSSSSGVAAAGANLSDQDYVGAVAQATVDADLAPDMTIGRCWADGMNDDFGVDRMRELNLADPTTFDTGSAMTEEEALQAATSLDSCIDLKKLVVEQAPSPEDRESTQCQVDRLTDDEMKQLVATLLSGTPPSGDLTAKLQEAEAQCGGG